MKITKTLGFFFGCFIAASLWANASPIPMLDKAAKNILHTLKSNKGGMKNNPKIIFNAVHTHLLPIVDVTGMARSVLGRQAWKSASPQQRQAFIHEFTQLIIRTYATPLTEYSDETIKFLPIRGSTNQRFLRVSSLIIRSHAPDIPLNYSLVLKKGHWKIYDITVEGVSLLQSFRSQFAQSLQQASLQQLINELKHHNRKAG